MIYNIGGYPHPYIPNRLVVKPRKNLTKLLYREMRSYDSVSIVGIYGKTGAGKSIYALKIGYEFYRNWNEVLKYVVFTPFDLQEAIDYLCANNEWIPILIWDDAGPWLELLKRASWHPLSIGIRGMFETLRINLGALLLTMTSETSLPRTIRNNGNIYKYRVRIIRNGKSMGKTPQSKAEIQIRREKTSEWGKYYWDHSSIYVDYFNLKIPNYEKYQKIRNNYLTLYSKLIMASHELGLSRIIDYIYNEWKKLKESIKWKLFYET